MNVKSYLFKSKESVRKTNVFRFFTLFPVQKNGILII